MGFVDRLTGKSQMDAASNASNQQIAAGERAIDVLRSDLKPYTQAGQQVLPSLINYITNPQAQADYVMNNPLFSAMSDDIQRRVFANQAARGKLGSGETLTALQNNLIPLGMQMAQQNFSNMFNVGTMGANAAAQTGTGTANLQTQIGNAQSAGTMAYNQAGQGYANNLLNIGAGAGMGAMGMLPGVAGGGGGALMGGLMGM